MPELPEVETVRRGLESQVCRFVVDRVEVLRTRAIVAPAGDGNGFAAALAGCAVRNTTVVAVRTEIKSLADAPADRERIRAGGVDIAYTDYDWALNDAQ